MKHWLLLFAFCHLCYSSDHVFYVRDLRGNPMPDLAIGTRGGNSSLTDSNGKLILTIIETPGCVMQLVIANAEYRWIAPYDGQLTVAAKLAGNPDLIVAKKREKDVITTQAGIEALMKLALDQMQPKGQGQEVDVQTALKQVAASWGLPVADIEKAIRDYQTHDVYQQGLKKLLENKYREAEPLLEEAVQNKLVDLVEAQQNLGLSLFIQGKYTKAAVVYRQAYLLKPKDHALRNKMLFAMIEAAEYQSLEPLVRKAVTEDEAEEGDTGAPRSLTVLACLLEATNRYSEAELLFRRSLALDEAYSDQLTVDYYNRAMLQETIRRSAVGTPVLPSQADKGLNHYSTLAVRAEILKLPIDIYPLSRRLIAEEIYIDLNNLAQLLKTTNRPSSTAFLPCSDSIRMPDAESYMRLAINEARFRPTISRGLNNLALLLQATNCLADAEPLLDWALSIDAHFLGRDHPNVATYLNNLAALLQFTNRMADAEPLMRMALAIDEAFFSTNHPNVARDLNNLALLLMDTDCLADAEPLMRRALAINEASFDTDHPDIATDLNNLAALLQTTNRMADAEPLMRRALVIDEASFGAYHPNVAIDLHNLACLLVATERREQALPLWRRALEIFTVSLGADHPNTTTVQKWLDDYLE